MQRDHPRGLAAQDLGSLSVKACYVAPAARHRCARVAKLMCPSPVARLLWERPSADAELNRDLVRLLWLAALLG